MADYFKVDRRKISLREYWNIQPTWKVLILWIGARLNPQFRFGHSFRRPQSVQEMEVPETEFSSQAKTSLQPSLEQCLQLGFHSPRYYSFKSLRRDTETSFIAMPHRSGQFTVRLMHTLSNQSNPRAQSKLVVLLSELSDGTYFCASDQREKFRSAPGTVTNRLIGASPSQLVEFHQQKLAERAANAPKPVLSLEELDSLWNRYEAFSNEFGIKRGLYVRMSPEEVAHEEQIITSAKAMMPNDGEHADVIVALSDLQNGKAGWGNAIILLIVSLTLFVGAGSRQWSWSYLLILVPVLFVHELGHYLAMRAFNYRNLRMFFIPFFGAAVAGRHYNVPGWKKVVVSLMGPMPGIFLGVILGVTGMILHNPLLIKIALVALILNGFNLLPVLPLDGGWIAHTLVFSRHPLMDASFRVLAAAALMAIGIFSHSRILGYLGIFMFLGVPAAYRTAQIVAALREGGLQPVSEEGQTIPPDVAQRIITEVKKKLGGKQTTKMVAEQSLHIFETLNARTPRWPATIGLMFVHGMSLGIAIVFAAVFMVGQRGDLRGALANATIQPNRPLACGPFLSWRGDNAGALSEAPPTTIIANFASETILQTSLQGLTNRMPSSSSVTRFGTSLFLTFPASDAGLRKRWFRELRRQTRNLFVDGTNYHAALAVSFEIASPERSSGLENELSEYFDNNSTGTLIPPWLPNDPRTAPQKTAHQLARKTYLKAQTLKWAAYSDPKISTLDSRIDEAKRQGDEIEIGRLTRQMTELVKELQKQRLDKLKSGVEGPVDGAVIDLFNALPSGSSDTNVDEAKKAHRELLSRMGQLPAGENRFSERGGLLSRKSTRLTLSGMSFNRINEGAPALIDWLCGHGCSNLKYEIRAVGASDGSEAE